MRAATGPAGATLLHGLGAGLESSVEHLVGADRGRGIRGPDGGMSWQVAIGTWAHNWLRDGLKEANRLGTAAAFSVHVRAAADRALQVMQARAAQIGVPLYPWWEQVWAEAYNAAHAYCSRSRLR